MSRISFCGWVVFVLALSMQLSFGCKTTDDSSGLDAWSLNGSEDLAREFIVSTVVANYPSVKPEDLALLTFATALMDRTVEHAETTQYILDAKNAEGKAELERYIINEFATSTNIFEILDDGGKLRYLGPADKISVPGAH